MANMNRDKTSGDIEAFKLALTCTLIKLALNSRSWPKPLSATLSGEIELGKNRTLKSDEQRRRSPLVEHSLVHRALVHGVDKLSAPVRTRRIMAPPSHKSRLIINNNSTIDQQQRQRLIINNSMHASTPTALIACMRIRSLPSGSALISASSSPSFPPPFLYVLLLLSHLSIVNKSLLLLPSSSPPPPYPSCVCRSTNERYQHTRTARE